MAWAKKRYLVWLLSALMSPTVSFAQVDPSSALLLRSSGKSPDKEELDSSRYTVRPSSTRSAPTRAEPVKTKVEAGSKVTESQAEAESVAADKATSSNVEASEEQAKEIHRLNQISIGSSGKEILEYKRHLSPYDPRQNLVEIDIAPTYMYNDSSSNYWFRDYGTHGPGLNLEARLWLSPFLSFYGSFLTSLSTSMKTSSTTSEQRPVDHQIFRAGVKMRRYFGLSRRAPYLSFGLGFHEYQLRMTSDIQERVGLRSAGAELSIAATVPVNNNRAWMMGVAIVPRVNHSENKTALDLKSGTSEESNSVGIWLGNRYNFDGRNQMYWKLHHSVERNAFEGEANQPDPTTGTNPNGVSVTNSMTRLEIGFTWGN